MVRGTMVRLEWVGLPSILANPKVAFALITHRNPPAWEAMVRESAGMRHPRLDGITVRRFEPRHFPGLSRTYEFGPDTYIRELPDDDASILLHSDCARQFVDIGRGESAFRPFGPPDLDLDLISEEEFSNLEQYAQASRRYQPVPH
jgi:hypothetical protein